ncbi:hypothetical protein D3C78_1595290 [compost metagenome]
MLESADQRRHAQDAVDVQHDGGIDAVAHQRGRAALGRDDGQHDDFHQDRRQRQDHAAVGVTQPLRDAFGVARHA